MILMEYLHSGFPVLMVLTEEPTRAEKHLPFPGNWTIYAWDCAMGIRPAGSLVGVEDLRDPVEALNWLTSNSNTILMMHNLHLFMNSAELIQTIQSGAEIWKAKGNCCVCISPIVVIPPELKSIFTVIDLPLPDAESLYALQFDLGSPHNIRPNKKAAHLARGLTEFEAECAYSLSLVRTKYFSSKVVSEVKSQLIRKSGLLECWEPEDIANVGGLRIPSQTHPPSVSSSAPFTNRPIQPQPATTSGPESLPGQSSPWGRSTGSLFRMCRTVEMSRPVIPATRSSPMPLLLAL